MSSEGSQDRFVAIYGPRNSHEAGLIRETLEANDIICYIDNENYYNVGAVVAIGAKAMTVMVPETVAAQAKDIIDGLGLK